MMPEEVGPRQGELGRKRGAGDKLSHLADRRAIDALCSSIYEAVGAESTRLSGNFEEAEAGQGSNTLDVQGLTACGILATSA